MGDESVYEPNPEFTNFDPKASPKNQLKQQDNKEQFEQMGQVAEGAIRLDQVTAGDLSQFQAKATGRLFVPEVISDIGISDQWRNALQSVQQSQPFDASNEINIVPNMTSNATTGENYAGEAFTAADPENFLVSSVAVGMGAASSDPRFNKGAFKNNPPCFIAPAKLPPSSVSSLDGFSNPFTRNISAVSVGRYRPFRDDPPTIGAGGTFATFYHVGTPARIMRGFESPLKDKARLTINIPNVSNAILTRYDSSYTDRTGPEYSGKDLTGFRYYNFSKTRWEQIGLTDPGTSQDLGYTFTYSMANDKIAPMTPHRFKPYQFSMSSHDSYLCPSISSLQRGFGYENLAAPTIAGAAPFAGIYHATASQAFPLSVLITAPFLLEKAVLNIPIIASRSNGPRNVNMGLPDTLKADGANRDIDNYTFFIYRQQKIGDHLVDSIQDCSSSMRYLVMSGAITFYNSPTWDNGTTTSVSSSLAAGQSLPHTPAFSHDFNIPVSGTTAVNAAAVYTSPAGGIDLRMIPAVASQRFLGASRFPTDGTSGNTIPYGQVQMQDYWMGGTTQPSQSFGIEEVTIGNGNNRLNFFGKYNGLDPSSINRVLTQDSRPRKNPAGLSTANTNPPDKGVGRFSTDVDTTTWSPYLLFPEDELVFGFDAGVSSTRTYDDDPISDPVVASCGNVRMGSISGMTGSSMVIQAGAASLTLFGSLVRLNHEVLPNRYQNLSSANIRVAYDDGYILDQYEIEQSVVYSGSYIDNFLTGSIFDNSRAVIGDFSANTAPVTSGSLVRSIRLTDRSERFYDSVMPAMVNYGKRWTGSTFGVTPYGIPILRLTESRYGEFDKFKSPFPYDTRVERQFNQKILLQNAIGLPIAHSVHTPGVVETILFSIGWRNQGAAAARLSHFVTGSKGYKYGIANIKPYNSTAVFRYGRFGQFRDMLEQRPFTKFFYEPTRESTSIDDKRKLKEAGFVVARELGQSAVTQRFFDSSGIEVEWSSTTLINVSTDVTSSRPYIEDSSQTYGKLPPSVVYESITVGQGITGVSDTLSKALDSATAAIGMKPGDTNTNQAGVTHMKKRK
jgi:hypothetical protein